MRSPLSKIGIAAIILAAGAALAQGPGYGPGARGGYGPGMGGGYGPGMGGAYGPGMGGGYGPGMGRGMMGGGYGPGQLAAPNVTAEQRQELAAMQERHRSENWSARTQMREEQWKLRDLYAAPQRDPAAIAAQTKKVDELRGQMWRSHEERRRERDATLAPQR